MAAEARTQLKLLASVPADAIDVPALRQAIETARAAGVSAMLLRAAASNLQDAIAQQQQAVDDRAGSQPAAFAERKEEFSKRSDEKVRQVLQDQDQQEPDWGVWCAGGGMPAQLHSAATAGGSALTAACGVNTSDGNGTSVLMAAYEGGHSALVRWLLEAGASADAQDRLGRTVLMRAAMDRDFASVDMLLRHGAAATVQDSSGFSALHHARSAECIELLAHGRADINSRSHSDRTPLFVACMMSGVGPFADASSRIHALLRLGADSNLLGRDGMSPLMGASARGGLQVVEALLAARADVAHKSPAGLTAMSAASTAGNSDVVATLLRARGDAVLQPGTKVFIHNLHGRPDMNNQTASVVDQKFGMVDPADNRVIVRLEREGSTEQATVKHENIEEIQQSTAKSPFAGVKVVLKDLVSKPELNGLKGMAIALDGSTGRYAVRLEDGSRLAIRPSNLGMCRDGWTIKDSASGESRSLDSEDARQMFAGIESAMSNHLTEDLEMPEAHVCAVCGTSPASLCRKCVGIAYCSIDCQKVDWPAHKQSCKQKERRGEAMPRAKASAGLKDKLSWAEEPSEPQDFALRYWRTVEQTDEQVKSSAFEKLLLQAERRSLEFWHALIQARLAILLCGHDDEPSLRRCIDLHLAAAVTFRKLGEKYREGNAFADASIAMRKVGEDARSKSYEQRGLQLMMNEMKLGAGPGVVVGRPLRPSRVE